MHHVGIGAGFHLGAEGVLEGLAGGDLDGHALVGLFKGPRDLVPDVGAIGGFECVDGQGLRFGASTAAVVLRRFTTGEHTQHHHRGQTDG